MVDLFPALVAAAAALALFAWVGFRARTLGDLDDYLVARNSQTSWTLGLNFLATGMGAWILFAPPEVGAGVGLVAIVGYALGAAAPVAAFGLLGPRLRRIVPAGHALTEFLRLRFGRVFHAYVVGISILYMLVFVIAELTAVGAVTEIVTGSGGAVMIVAVAAVTAAYTAYGGLRASMRTDRWQAWLILALLALAAVAVMTSLEAPAQAWRASGRIGVDRLGVEAGITLFIAVLAANLFHQGYWQRVWAARDDRALRRGSAIGVGLTIPVVLLVGALGITAAGAGLPLGEPPAPFFALLTGLPAALGIVVCVLGVSLVASSVDTLENALASLVVAERPRTTLTAARVVTVVLLVPAVALALRGYSVLRIFLIADLLAATAAVPAMMGLARRTTSAGALSGAVAGIAGAILPGVVSTGSVSEGVLAATFPASIPTLGPFLGAVVLSSVVTVGVSALGGKPTDLASLNERVPVLDRV